MPRTADHAERRRQIAGAVCELIADGGLDTVTVARAAERSGVSVGLVQHYFRTKDDMLLHAFHLVSARIQRRLAERVRIGSAHREPIAAILRDALHELLPVDAERRAEFRVARAFAGRSLDSPRLAGVDTETADGVRRDVARGVHNGKECGEVDPGLDSETAAARLAAVTEGLAAQVYRDGTEAAHTATAILRAEVAAVFTGECRQYA